MIASLFFYSWWNIYYLPLILLSILVNYSIHHLLTEREKYANLNRKFVLVLGLVFNLLMLGIFKYADFVIYNTNSLFLMELPLPHFLLPLAISFFSFQQIAFIVDTYKGQIESTDMISYIQFVAFFPQLIAGPIVHHKEMIPQFNNPDNHRLNWHHIATGLFIFSIGLFKKVILADTFALWATAGFDTQPQLSFLDGWMTSLSYTFQLYFDFSGYCDMAVGAALLFNIHLPINFNSPYKSVNIQDFWRRWHITLSRFFKTYLYIPLGGNRTGQTRMLFNLFIVYVLSGLWHGAGWNFVFWGTLHGIAAIIHRLWSKTRIKMPTILAWMITFQFINITWIFFRAKTWSDAIKVLSSMLGINGFNWSQFTFAMQNIFNSYTSILWIAGAFILCLAFKNSNQRAEEFKADYKHLILTLILGLYGVLSLNKVSEFLYFNF